MDPESTVSETTGLPAGWTPEDLLAKLPPFPRPNEVKQKEQFRKGCMAVTFQVVLNTAGTYWGNILLDGSGVPSWYVNFVNCAIGFEVVLAFVSFFLTIYMVPAPLERNRENCLPVPKAVADKLVKGEELVFAKNIVDKDIGEYCVRCFVWRRKPAVKSTTGVTLFWATHQYHHCSVCQRCHWNHFAHNPFTGTCVAGDGFRGNLGVFRVLHFMGTLGLATTSLVLVPGLWFTEMGRYVMYVVLLAINATFFAYFWAFFDQLSYLCGRPKVEDPECVFPEWVLGDQHLWKGRGS